MRVGLGALASVCAVCAFAEDELEEPLQLTVMSFNIRYGTAEDGENAWGNRQELMVRLLKEHQPDLIGTQECLEFQAGHLVEQLPEYGWFGRGREETDTGERMAILYRKGVLEPVETGNFWLSQTPEVPGSRSWAAACTRMVTWARFRHISSGREFYHFNTHFDHFSAIARWRSAHLLADRVHEIAGDAPVVVTGDFNTEAGRTAPWEILVQNGLKDAWVAATEREGPTQTFIGFEAPDPDVDARIDWILVNGGFKPLTCRTLDFSEKGRYPSDHLPVVTTLALSEKGAMATAGREERS